MTLRMHDDRPGPNWAEWERRTGLRGADLPRVPRAGEDQLPAWLVGIIRRECERAARQATRQAVEEILSRRSAA